MPAVKVAECETAEDVRRLARERYARVKIWNTPKQPIRPDPIPEPDPEPDPEPKLDLVSLWPPKFARLVTPEVAPHEQWIMGLWGMRPVYTLAEIREAVARAYHITIPQITADRRDQLCVKPRAVGYMISRCFTGHSLLTIGKLFGGRDHTTVLHGIRKVKWLEDALKAELTLADGPVAWANRASELYP